MFNQIKKTIKHLVIYSLGGVSNKIVGLILLPLYTSYLASDQYGTLAILEITSQLIVEVFSLSLANGLMRWVSSEKNQDRVKSIIFTTSIATLLLAGLISAVLIPMSDQLSLLLFSTINFSDYFIILVITSSLNIFTKIPLVIIRINEKSFFYLISTTLRFLTVLVCNVYFVAELNMGVMGIITGQLIGSIVLLFVTLPHLIKHFKYVFDVDSLKNIITYSFPLIFSTISAMVFNLGDRYFLQYFLDLSRVGIYSLGYKIGSIINTFLIQSFYLGFIPIAFKKLGQPDEKRYLSKILTYFTFVIVFLSIILSLFSQEAIKLFTMRKEYWEAYFIVPLITFALSIKGIQFIYTLGFQYKKETKYQAMLYTGSAIVSVVLNILFIPLLNIYGSGLTSIITFSLMALASYKLTSRLYPIPYENKKIIQMIFLGATIISVGILSFNLSFLYRLPIKLILVILFPLILYFIGFYEPIEIETLKRIWSNWGNPLNWKKNLKQIKL